MWERKWETLAVTLILAAMIPALLPKPEKIELPEPEPAQALPERTEVVEIAIKAGRNGIAYIDGFDAPKERDSYGSWEILDPRGKVIARQQDFSRQNAGWRVEYVMHSKPSALKITVPASARDRRYRARVWMASGGGGRSAAFTVACRR